MMRRIWIQLAATFLTNPHVTNLLSGKLYRGGLKNLCAPGLNCWSCPAATLSCPVGALQAGGTYAAGFVLLIGVLFGRAVCGFLCPFGLIQELLNKIPSPRLNVPRRLLRVKYFLTAALILSVATEVPLFCEYVCPAGTLEAGLPLIATHEEFRGVLGKLFALKVLILLAVILGSVVVHRFFCRVLCPLGAIYGLLNRYSFYQLQCVADKCGRCGRCKAACPIDLDPTKECNSVECVRCGRCVAACPTQALKAPLQIVKTS